MNEGTSLHRVGPLKPWCTAQDVLNFPARSAAEKIEAAATAASLVPETVAQEAADAASEILYWASGRQFPGLSDVISVRPVSRPHDLDSRAWNNRAPGGYISSWGTCTAYGTGGPSGVVNHYGCTQPPEVTLGAFPVVSIAKVLIDGVLIPPNEYEIAGDRRTLIRRRPSASANPTQRFGWPTCQMRDLPDTEPGTFAVYFIYGVDPPAAGVRAAKRLAYEFALDSLNISNSLPPRVTNVSRQGVTTAVRDIIDYLAVGRLGIPVVDTFLKFTNPSGTLVRPLVWSPDIGRPRRVLS